MEYYFAPMEGLTDSVYRHLHHKYFQGPDKYYMPFFSPTVHRSLTPREARELPFADTEEFLAVPQILGKNPEDFLWAAPRERFFPRERAPGFCGTRTVWTGFWSGFTLRPPCPSP